jgi:geranylgeranyl pyrophosphate synthase
MNHRVHIPTGDQLIELLGLPEKTASEAVLAAIDTALHGPLVDFLNRPGKTLRGQMVEIGYGLALGEDADDQSREKTRILCDGLSKCVEALHAGSLIVDDIEDDSEVRRGQPTLHRRYGVAVALNAGNWLYFRALHHLLSLNMRADIERRCIDLLNRTLLRAHYGQAIDVGMPIDACEQTEAYELCMTAIRLKSGTLTSLALSLGGAAASGGDDCRVLLEQIGERLGTALQLFDDLRNLERPDPHDPTRSKRLEDLYQRRPSWIWAFAARTLSPRDYSDFKYAVRQLPDETLLHDWLTRRQFKQMADNAARAYLDETLSFARDALGEGPAVEAAIGRIQAVSKMISGA